MVEHKIILTNQIYRKRQKQTAEQKVSFHFI